MSADYEPGTVAIATVLGVKGVRVMRATNIHGVPFWLLVRPLTSPGVDWQRCFAHDDELTDVLPLVVLDVQYDPQTAKDIVKHLRKGHFTSTADQIEAQAKPPRIPEPGQWGVVEASWPSSNERFKFVRVDTDNGLGHDWQVTEDGSWASWDELVNPTLIREGVES